jgi:PAS domain-containing protein
MRQHKSAQQQNDARVFFAALFLPGTRRVVERGLICLSSHRLHHASGIRGGGLEAWVIGGDAPRHRVSPDILIGVWFDDSGLSRRGLVDILASKGKAIGRDMKKVCAWCGRAMGETGGFAGREDVVSHGICPACAEAVFPELGVDLGVFLDRFNLPILVVDAEGMVRSANVAARAMLHKDEQAITQRPGGEVFECVHSRLAEGCGHTVHCSGCTINQAIRHTAASGQPVRKRPARVTEGDGTQKVYVISTERKGEVVLLQVDEVRGAMHAAVP